jgi:predicted enzyme related to lactoylglutathione lyase
MDFASVRILTDDVDRLTAFYEFLTGTAAERPAPVFSQFLFASSILAIASPITVAMLGAAASAPAGNTSVIIEFEVTDVDAGFARLRDGLDDIVLEPATMPWGNRSAIVRDPDGNLVNIFSRPASGIGAAAPPL